MVKTKIAGRMSKAVKLTKMGSTVHPKSRKANRIGKALIHEQRVEQRHNARQTKQDILGDKLAWFRDELLSNDYGLNEKKSLNRDEIRELLLRYVEYLKDSLAAARNDLENLPKKRIPTASQLKREQRLVVVNEHEIGELDAIGMEIPDLLSVKNVQKVREWAGDTKVLPSISFVRFKL